MAQMQTTAAIEMQLSSWRGYSAYEIAKQQGFEGTEAEWLESLKGEKGEASDDLTVNNKAPVDGNITIRATDIYMQPALATETVAQAIEKRLLKEEIVDGLDSEEAAKALSAAQGRVLAQQIAPKAQVITHKALLPAASWTQEGELYTQSADVEGVTIDVNKTSVIVSPPTDRAMEEMYLECAVRAGAQGDGVLVFTCTELPGIDLEANVMVVILGQPMSGAAEEAEA